MQNQNVEANISHPLQQQQNEFVFIKNTPHVVEQNVSKIPVPERWIENYKMLSKFNNSTAGKNNADYTQTAQLTDPNQKSYNGWIPEGQRSSFETLKKF